MEQTVYVVMWDRGTEADPIAWVHASDAGADQRHYDLMKENWHEVAAYDGYPAEIPGDLDTAEQLWDDARENNAEPKIGIITVDAVTLGA